MLVIDGSQGEGGGQILRTALSLAAVLGRHVRIEAIRARRPNPGLAAQHLTALRALATICQARVSGDAPGSRVVEFEPTSPPAAGAYRFDVAAARQGGSAGAVTLVLQAIVLPLAAAQGDSRVALSGGTHMAWSPPFDYVEAIWLPAVRRMGIDAQARLARTGWFPIGQGSVDVEVRGRGALPGALRPLEAAERGRLVRWEVHALAANLPAHIPQRMATRAANLLSVAGVPVEVRPQRVTAACAGAALSITGVYEHVKAGFNALGAPGKPSEAVAEEAVELALAHYRSGAALDRHLADQVLVPLALAAGPSRFTTDRATEHLQTNAWVIEQFGLATIRLDSRADGTAEVRVTPAVRTPT